MRAAWLSGPSRIDVVDTPDPSVVEPTDVVVRILFAGVCGSDLWGYRGLIHRRPGGTGHEFVGVVADVGSKVLSFRVGDPVIAPFLFSDGTCTACRAGLQPLCPRAGIWGKNWAGAQAQAIRVPFADAVLVRLPWSAAEIDVPLAKRLIPLCDVLATGTHGAKLAGVSTGDHVIVVGDGAVGVSAALASLRSGAADVLVLGERPERLQIAEQIGARSLRVERDEPDCEAVLAASGGRPADCAIECVGMQAAFDTALDVVRAAGSVSFVGVPNGIEPIPPGRIFNRQLRLAGGVAPARHYLDELLRDVRDDQLDPSILINRVCSLDDVAEAYEAMDGGHALKVLLDVR